MRKNTSGPVKLCINKKAIPLLFTRKLDTCCQAVRQRLYHARLQPHASKMHLKWAVIVTAHTVCVNSNAIPEFKINSNTAHETSNIVSF